MFEGMANIDVSIIIPVYNVESYIAECLQSVISQSASCPIECILVDDRGSDGSMFIARQLISEYRGPIVFNIVKRERNGGLSAARNSGIRAARGKYIFLLDSDDLITPNCIKLLYDRANQYPEAQIITGNFQTFPEKDVHKPISLTGKNFPTFSNDKKWIRSVFLTSFPVTAWNKLIKRDFIEKNELYFREGIIHEDNHWVANAYHNVSCIAFVDRITYLYRMREGSITQNPNANSRRLENFNVIYTEMFSKQVKWDKPWAEWVLLSLDSLRYSSNYQTERLAALQYRRNLMKVIIKNPNAPMIMKLLMVYYNLPKHKGQNRIFYSLFNRYWRNRD